MSLDIEVAPPAARRPSRVKAIVSSVVGLLLMVAIFAVLFPQVASYQSAWAQLQQMTSGWVVALIAAGIINILIYPFTVFIAVPGLGYWHSFVQRQAGFLVSNVVPGGGAFAVGTQYSVLAKYGVAPSAAAAAVAADAVWTYLLTLGFPTLAVLMLVIEGRATPAYITIAIVGAVIVAVSVLAIVTILRSDAGARRVGTLATRVVNRLLKVVKRPARDLVPSLVTFGEHARGLVQRRWLLLTITNAAAQLTPLLVLLAALGGVGAWPGQITLVEAFATYTIALLLTSFPITPGGLGTVDAALIGLLVAFGADRADAVVVDLLWRLVWFLPQLIAGAIAMGVYLLSKRREQHRLGGVVA